MSKNCTRPRSTLVDSQSTLAGVVEKGANGTEARLELVAERQLALLPCELADFWQKIVQPVAQMLEFTGIHPR